MLQEALVPIIPDYKCQHSDAYGAKISENMFCAGYFDGKTDACQVIQMFVSLCHLRSREPIASYGLAN